MIVMDDIESTYKSWSIYRALYLHFTGDYDYHRYGGKSARLISVPAMEKHFSKYEANGNYSSQRLVFQNLSKNFENKEDLTFFFLSQFTNGYNYPTVFDSDIYDEYKERMNNFDFHFKQDIQQIKKYLDKYEAEFDDIFKVIGINHPTILKMVLSKTISMETFTVLDIILGFVNNIDKALDDPLWSDQSKLVKNYKPFLSVDINKQKKIIMGVLNKG